MSGWQLLALCWICYVLGFATAALMNMARGNTDDQAVDYRAGLNDD